jgi:hypothetical protein
MWKTGEVIEYEVVNRPAFCGKGADESRETTLVTLFAQICRGIFQGRCG